MARTAERRLGEFNAHGLANTAWAFATLGFEANEEPAEGGKMPKEILDFLLTLRGEVHRRIGEFGATELVAFY